MTTRYLDDRRRWIYRSELEETFLKVNITCNCSRLHRKFPPSCVREEYKEIVRSDLANGLLSNYCWIRELAAEIIKEDQCETIKEDQCRESQNTDQS